MMVSDEKTPLLSHVVLVVPGEVATVPQDVVLAAALVVDPWKGLSNTELMAMARDPFWVRMRAFAFWTFWMCWLALLVAALVVVFTSPRCPDLSCDNTTLPTTAETDTMSDWTTLTVPT